jgi:hypothetical protein
MGPAWGDARVTQDLAVALDRCARASVRQLHSDRHDNPSSRLRGCAGAFVTRRTCVVNADEHQWPSELVDLGHRQACGEPDRSRRIRYPVISKPRYWPDRVGSNDPEALGIGAQDGIVASPEKRRESRAVRAIRPLVHDTHVPVDPGHRYLPACEMIPTTVA